LGQPRAPLAPPQLRRPRPSGKTRPRFEARLSRADANQLPMTTPKPVLREPTRETLAPLLIRRFRLMAPSILIGTGAFAALHIMFAERQLGLLLVLKIFQAGITIGALWICRHYPTRRAVAGSLLAVTVTLNFVTAVTGVLIGNVHTNVLLYVIVALTTSSFLPWGPFVQTLSVISAGAAAIGPTFTETPLYHDIWYDLTALAVAFALSIYIAREVEKDTLSEYRAQAATQALVESRADIEGVFRSSNVLLALVEISGDDFVYIDVNDTLAGAFGHTTEAMKGMTGAQSGFTPDEVREWRANFQRCSSQGSLQVPEYRLPMADPERWYHIDLSAIREGPGAPSRFSVAAVDITARKYALEDIRRLNLDLEAQVCERTRLLEAANKDLESFAYSVSHDLRTPLRTIEGFASLLTDDHGSELSATAKMQLARIRSASRHMAQLIDDMLMLSRASRSEMRREPVDVTLLARGLAHELRSTKEDRKATIEVESGLVADADPQLLRIVMTNLLGNAWKYTGRRDETRIEIASEIYEGEEVFVVRDNGCGFDMRFVGKLFQPFQRLHAAEEFEGTGVGLATVARIVRRHGGKVWAEGAPGRGATFRFTVGSASVVNPS